MECTSGDWGCEFTRIADALSGFDWNGFAATLLATVVGAAFAAGFTWWLAARDRPKPVWRVDVGPMSDAPDDEGKGSAKIVATNIGDGPAYNAAIDVNLERARWETPQAVVTTGESISCWYTFPMTGFAKYDVTTGNRDDTRKSDWGRPHARITWRQPPRRTKDRSERRLLISPNE